MENAGEEEPRSTDRSARATGGRLVVGFDFVEEAVHGALNVAIGLERAFDDGPIGVVSLKACGGDFGDFVFVGTDYVSETETTRL